MRLLMIPDAEASGGGDAVVDTKVEVKPPVVETKPPEIKGRVVSDEDYADLSRLRTEATARKDAERRAEEEKLREKGKWEEIVRLRDEALASETKRAGDLETRTKRSVLGKELASALAEQPLVKGASGQLAKLWSDEFEVNPSGDDWRVETRDRKSVADFVKEKLASDEFSHFVKADARGGAGASGTKPTPAEIEANKPKPGSVEAIASAWKAGHQSHGASALYMRNF